MQDPAVQPHTSGPRRKDECWSSQRSQLLEPPMVESMGRVDLGEQPVDWECLGGLQCLKVVPSESRPVPVTNSSVGVSILDILSLSS